MSRFTPSNFLQALTPLLRTRPKRCFLHPQPTPPASASELKATRFCRARSAGQQCALIASSMCSSATSSVPCLHSIAQSHDPSNFAPPSRQHPLPQDNDDLASIHPEIGAVTMRWHPTRRCTPCAAHPATRKLACWMKTTSITFSMFLPAHRDHVGGECSCNVNKNTRHLYINLPHRYTSITFDRCYSAFVCGAELASTLNPKSNPAH